ncbi:triacylglycerol lipase [Cladophialophora chaetospira]|uniref:Triacylglycerol lipase n=1 Tax=Cladophialophora chaetospira TaxID=386627 RepID=A0AA39CQE1_9EURO|nr:triacylglycerol lipase [Cladophialophora chaetospira]
MSILLVILGYFRSILRSALLLVCITPWTKSQADQRAPPSTYDQWYDEQAYSDTIHFVDDWAVMSRQSCYDWEILHTMKKDLERCRRLGDERGLCSQLRAQCSRNMCRILSPALYQRSQIQTKKLIHDYVREVQQSIIYLGERTGVANGAVSVVPAQEKRQVIIDMRTTLGRTSLLLQGGAIISMVHLGVVKALFEQRLLPRIITGTSTGALIAAHVCVTKDEDLLGVLDATSINLDAFARSQNGNVADGITSWFGSTFFATVKRRWRRYRTSHHVFDIDVLKDCTQANLGDITFEEAYQKTGRILNITIAMSEVAGTPQLLNYLTAPHVLVRSAVVASIATSKAMYAPVQLLCKNPAGELVMYFAADFSEKDHNHRRSTVHPEAPLTRIGELFNVNHFIVSQTRPYIAPFIQLQRFADRHQPLGLLVRFTLFEWRHWLEVLNQFNKLPTILQRVLVDEVVPTIASWSKVSITPQLGLKDLLKTFDTPTPAKLQEWSARGEKCTWPYICELKVRCDIELELDAAYTRLRRTGALGATIRHRADP